MKQTNPPMTVQKKYGLRVILPSYSMRPPKCRAENTSTKKEIAKIAAMDRTAAKEPSPTILAPMAFFDSSRNTKNMNEAIDADPAK
jgi:hypothetical protein